MGAKFHIKFAEIPRPDAERSIFGVRTPPYRSIPKNDVGGAMRSTTNSSQTIT
jgi:hypothetical protein